MKNMKGNEINKERRNFLKILLIGGGVFVAGKVLGPTVSKLVSGPSVENDFQNFKTIENENGLSVYDKSGQEIFIMDNGKE